MARFADRHGVSPLIAAVLLIAFTMAVAAILTAWVTTFTQEQTGQISNETGSQIRCSFANIQILDADFGGTSVTVAVTNTGDKDLTNVSVTAFSGSNVLDVSGDRYIDPLNVGQTKSTQVTSSGSNPDRVRVAALNCPAVTATVRK